MSDIQTTATGAASALMTADTTTAPAATETGTTAPAAATTQITGTKPETWYSGLADESIRGYAEIKGWNSIDDAILSHQQLETVIGADKAGNTLVMPTKDSTPEQVAAYYEKLGVPKTAADYKLLADGQEPTEFTGKAAEWFKEANVPAESAQLLANKFNEYAAAQQEAADQKFYQESEAKLAAFKASPKYTEDAYYFQQAVTALGKGNDLPALERAMGFDWVRDHFTALGRGMGEHKYVAGAGGAMGLTPEGAKMQLKKFQDPATYQKWVNGDPTLTQEYEQLTRIIAASA